MSLSKYIHNYFFLDIPEARTRFQHVPYILKNYFGYLDEENEKWRKNLEDFLPKDLIPIVMYYVDLFYLEMDFHKMLEQCHSYFQVRWDFKMFNMDIKCECISFYWVDELAYLQHLEDCPKINGKEILKRIVQTNDNGEFDYRPVRTMRNLLRYQHYGCGSQH